MSLIIVTGAAGNLGKAVADKFFDAGNNVIGIVRKNSSGKREQGSVQQEDIVVDLQDEDAVATFIQTTVQQYKTIDVAVLTAGGYKTGELKDTSVPDILQQVELNFMTAYTVAKPVFLQMQKQGSGHLFFIGAGPGKDITKSAGSVAYGLSKSLLFRLAELLKAEAHGSNVRVTVVVPGIIDTPENRKVMPDADFSKWTSPENIAARIYDENAADATSTDILFV